MKRVDCSVNRTPNTSGMQNGIPDRYMLDQIILNSLAIFLICSWKANREL